MTEQLSFIHAADLHLDSPFQGLASVPEAIFKQIQGSTFDALDNLVKTAIGKKVDFILLVGDLFDNERQSLKAQIKLKNAFEELYRHNINVYMSYGNHDFINGNTYPVTYPDNVYIFKEEKVGYFTFNQKGKPLANIHGFSYENRSINENKTAEFQVQNGEAAFHIAMLHGSLYSNTEHDTYAPFHLSELSDKEFDYFALGHIHQREIMKTDPPIIYSGNTQGRNRKEAGAKGCYHVVLDKGQAADVTFIPLQAIQFNRLTVDVSDCTEPHVMEKVIQHTIEEQSYQVPQLLFVELKGRGQSLNKWSRDGYVEETIELLNDASITKDRWDFIYRYKIKVNQAYDEKELVKGDHFIGELLRHSEDAPIHTYTEELYRHKQARKYIESMTLADENDIREQAKSLLINELLKGGD
ncbi:DNA repair exonuclease [Virgibacillus phasianinus]|uniref:DNA repair exonuclease n=1 Tax=Virgibacillus phasianinus TaxID=2017483 RepID=A0A220TYE7_9BACI|nr:DNA repair exonuclease [Virgibacillus phasianinus]ASK60878.1 DNA repair exonuclease [Virgibacillus phasianinus]